tara:strand:- start:93145 stop:93474 length:330 start_codon:yes stop_codon:yes gene_type:complete
MLYIATLVATRWNSRIKAFYLSLSESGIPKKLAIRACMRKFLTTLNSMMKNNQTWNQISLYFLTFFNTATTPLKTTLLCRSRLLAHRASLSNRALKSREKSMKTRNPHF